MRPIGVEPEQDAFSCAVFSQGCNDLAGADGEPDDAIGEQNAAAPRQLFIPRREGLDASGLTHIRATIVPYW
jgi:hypothetical protein